MSYEGYEQILCGRGHYHEMDCYELTSHIEKTWICDALVGNAPCGASIKTTNSVDDTNCDSYGYRKMIELTPQKVQSCDMGHTHVTDHATYKLSGSKYYRETKFTATGHETIWHEI